MSDATPSSENPEDDLKRKFREALERKQAQSRLGEQHEAGNGRGGHVHGRGPAGGKRTFRRKSG